MAIKREDVDRQMVDFSDVASGRRLSPVHPGQVLREEYLEPLGLSVYRLARELKIARPRLNDIVLGRRGVTIDTALRLGHYFGTTPEFWINLQTRHDLDIVARGMRFKIERELQPRRSLEAPSVNEKSVDGRRRMEEELCDVEKELRDSPGEWQWHAAQVIAEIPSGRLATYGCIAQIANQRLGCNLNARNIAWLRRHLYGLLVLGHDTRVPLHRVAKVGDVESLADSEETRRYNDRLRGQEGSLSDPDPWWHPL